MKLKAPEGGTDFDVEGRDDRETPKKLIDRLSTNVEKAIIGKPDVIRHALITLLSAGHLLIEDIPGVGKSTLAHAIARSVGGSFMRIQFTSDMLPSDIIGVSIYRKEGEDFEFVPGPIFHNFILADEINRTSPRTQSALLEAMNDGRVSVENLTYELERPFMILATQNPLEYHGTYPLPESQLDRFMMTIEIGYPGNDEEKRVVVTQSIGSRVDGLKPVLTTAELMGLQAQAEETRMEDSLTDYLMRLVVATRDSKYLRLGVSTRGAIFLRRAAKAAALTRGRDFVIPDDIKEMVLPVFSHRVVLKSSTSTSHGRSREARNVLVDIMESVPVPL
jgi:MoxR-like ATPase